MNLEPWKWCVRACAVAAVALGLVACEKRKPADQGGTTTLTTKEEDFVHIDADTTEMERVYLDYGRSIVNAVASRKYEEFYAQLSSHAKAQMSLNQFAPDEEDAKFAANEKQPRRDVALPEFLTLMTLAEKQFGAPLKPLNLHVHTTDPKVLAGDAAGGFEQLDVMFAIGNMPKLAPASIRKASLRASIGVKLSPEQMAEIAKSYETTVEELTKDEDFQPYLNLKLVLVDEEGSLKVGYFEFLPPSMLD